MGVSLNHVYLFWELGFLLGLQLTDWLDYVASVSRAFPVSASLALMTVAEQYVSILYGSWGLSFGPYACSASILPTVSAPPFAFSSFYHLFLFLVHSFVAV